MSSDHEEIRNALTVYCHALDDGEYERLAEIFDADTVYELRGGPFHGVAESVAALRALLPTLPRKRHLTTNTHIVVAGATAKVTSDWFSVNVELEGMPFSGCGRWIDDFERRGD